MSEKKKDIKSLIKTLKKKGYKYYEEPYKLNIVGIRSDNTKPNSFDDRIYVFFKTDSGKWAGKSYAATTDPGTYWLENPMNPQGTAVLMQGQYENAYQIGQHLGKYTALVQRKPVTVLRQYDRKALLDFYNGKEDTGLFGINIHRASTSGTTKSIDKWSAGCQVFANIDDYNEFMNLAQNHKDKYGNEFTYTLIDERAYNRMIKRRLTYAIVTAVVLSGATFLAYKKGLFNKIIK